MEFIDIDCPYCGESIQLAVDGSAGDQRYVEDCQVCCQPIEVSIRGDAGGGVAVDVRGGNDA